MDDSEADKPDALSLHDVNHKGSTSVKDLLSTSDKDKDEPMVKETAIPPCPDVQLDRFDSQINSFYSVHYTLPALHLRLHLRSCDIGQWYEFHMEAI